MIRLIAPTSVETYWPKVLPLLEPAIRQGRRATPEEVLQWLMRGDYQLWVYGDTAAATTAVTVYPGSRWLTIVHCGGTGLPEWLKDGIAAIERWAEGKGCDGVEIIGRPEWARVLGYEAVGTVMQRPLKEKAA